MDRKLNESDKKEVTFSDLYHAFLTYQKVLERFDKGIIDDGSYFVGYVLITSIICEIGIKALLICEGKDLIKEHKLDKLFNELSQRKQKEMATKCNYTLDEFKVQLSINNDHFVAWRYFYESNCKHFHPYFINKLIKALDSELC